MTPRRRRGGALLLSAVAVVLLSERGPVELFRSPLVYGALLALWGLWEMRPDATSADSSSASREPITP